MSRIINPARIKGLKRGPAIDNIIRSNPKIEPLLDSTNHGSKCGTIYLVGMTILNNSSTLGIIIDPNVPNTFYIDNTAEVANIDVKRVFCIGYFSGDLRTTMCNILATNNAIEVQIYGLVTVSKNHRQFYEQMVSHKTFRTFIQNTDNNHAIFMFSDFMYKLFWERVYQVIGRKYKELITSKFRIKFMSGFVSIPFMLKKIRNYMQMQ